jgi:transcriptional regulator with XRE-family HTH domain
MLKQIRKLCKEKKISIAKMERDLGFARGYIYKLGVSIPTISNAKKIADYLGITIDDMTKGA